MAQNQAKDDLVRRLRDLGYTDIRVNQQQVNAARERVGINRPDVQGTTPGGERHYFEFDRAEVAGSAGPACARWVKFFSCRKLPWPSSRR